MSAHYLIGDSVTVMNRLPEGCVDLVLTSPPFLALRSYLPDGHPAKEMEMGSEPNPAEFLDALLAWTAACGRVLAEHGSLCVELGDTYSGSGGGGGDMLPGGAKASHGKWSGVHAIDCDMEEGCTCADDEIAAAKASNAAHWRAKNKDKGAWPLPKSLALIPELYRVALAYGINPLTGAESPAGRWRVRNVVRWHRPNPPVGALGDKFRPATSDMVVACRSKDRWFDLDAVREAHKTDPSDGLATRPMQCNPAGAPPLDTWTIPTQPYKGSHYATWPEALCVRPIKAMCPTEVCRTCGEPRRRIAVTTNALGQAVGRKAWREDQDTTDMMHSGAITRSVSSAPSAIRETVGWTDCACEQPDYRPGVVLDPFAGSGTTLKVATGHGRYAIGIDLDERNLDLARERVGGFLLTDGDELPDWLHRDAGGAVA